MTVVPFVEYTPPRRFDTTAHPWTVARVEEAAAVTGPFTAIESITLDPVDTDPSQPQPRSFTTELATLTTGWYRIVFVDATGDESTPTIPVQNIDAGAVAWAPGAADVATLMFARTKGEYAQLTAFTNDTRPTVGQVHNAIRLATSVVALRVGFTLDARFHDSARTFTTLMAALLLEPGFWPDQQAGDKGAWEQWQKLYDDGMPGLIEAIREAGAGDDPGPSDDELKPVYSFPVAASALVPTRQEYIDRWLAGGGW